MLCIIKGVFQLYNILYKIAVICDKLCRICTGFQIKGTSLNFLICIFVMKDTRLVESLKNEHHRPLY